MPAESVPRACLPTLGLERWTRREFGDPGVPGAPHRALCPPSPLNRSCSALALPSDLLRLLRGTGNRPGSFIALEAGAKPPRPRDVPGPADARCAGSATREFAVSDRERRTLVPASIPRGGGEEAILSPSASYRTLMDLEPWRGRRQLAEPSETLPLLIGSWASVAETAKWERVLCSWNVCSPDPSRSSGDPTIRVRNVLDLQRPGGLGSEAALRLRTQRLGQGAAGPRQGPASGRGLGSFPWRPGLWLPARPNSASQSGSGDAESVPRGCRGLQAQATGAGLRWWRAGGPGALLRTTKRGRPSCAAPCRAGPARPFRLQRCGPALQAPSWATPSRPLLSLGSCCQSQ